MTHELIDRLGISGRNPAMPEPNLQKVFKTARGQDLKQSNNLGAVIRGYDGDIR